MTVYNVDVVKFGSPLQIDIERLENFLEAVVLRVKAQLARKTDGANIVLVDILVAKATCLDMAELCKFLRQELHMDASAAVNFRRKLIGKNSSVHTTNLRLHH